MPEIKFTELKCQRCGGEITETQSGVYQCKACGKKWQKETLHDFTDMLEACGEALRAQRIKLVANQRRQYTEELSGDETKNEYASFRSISACCTEIRKYIPEDFYANFFLAAISDRRGALDRFLKRVNLSERSDDIPYMLDFLIKYMRGLWLDAVSMFIERVKNEGYLTLYSKYRGEYEIKANDINNGVYDPNIPRDVFIAYSTFNLDRVLSLVELLESNGISCYYSARNLSKDADKYDENIATAIRNCKVLVFVSSKISRDRNRCDAYKELNYIRDNCPNMIRVQYLIENYSGELGKTYYDNFFGASMWKTSENEVAEYVYTKLLERDSYHDGNANTNQVNADQERERREAAEAERRRKLQEEKERKRREEEEAASAAAAAAEAERQRKAEEERKRREAEAAQRAEQERKRKEEEERRQRLIIEGNGDSPEMHRRKEERRCREEALKAFSTLGDYKKIGRDSITFGAYPQRKKAAKVKIGLLIDKERGYYLGSDNCLYAKKNGEYFKVEPIKWNVVTHGGARLLVADCILDALSFDQNSNSYADSGIRNWLNGEFYEKAFTEGQKKLIGESNQTIGGGLNDKIFLLGRDEAEECFGGSYARQKIGSDYAKANNIYVAGNGNSWWWLRSPHENQGAAQYVRSGGDFYFNEVGYASGGVVPALMLKSDQNEQTRTVKPRGDILSIGDYRDLGNGYVTFGMYPQSKKADNVTIGKLFDTERGYYIGSDNNLYAEWNGEYYKVEPIKWKVLKSGSEQFIVSDIILDAHRFDGSNSNNYANSEIRSWLNGEFYKKVFTESQRNLILTTKVDNSVSSTGYSTNQYVCENTNDKIFLLSRKEAERYYTSSSARQKKGTDYAKARGLWVNSNNGNSYWWLRSPFYDISDIAQDVNSGGDFYDWYSVLNSYYGVVCALKFKL